MFFFNFFFITFKYIIINNYTLKLFITGESDTAMRIIHNYHSVWKQYGFTPEVYNLGTGEASTSRESYPLRPELIESIMYLYRETRDPILLQMGEDILRSIQHSARTPCGYATVRFLISFNFFGFSLKISLTVYLMYVM